MERQQREETNNGLFAGLNTLNIKKYDGFGRRAYLDWKESILEQLNILGATPLVTNRELCFNPTSANKEKQAKHVIRQYLDSKFNYVRVNLCTYDTIQALDRKFANRTDENKFNIIAKMNALRYRVPVRKMFEEFDELVRELKAEEDNQPITHLAVYIYSKMPIEYSATIATLKQSNITSLDEIYAKLEAHEAQMKVNHFYTPRVLQANNHSDVWGPPQVESNTGHKYFVSFIDEYSHYCVVFLLSS